LKESASSDSYLIDDATDIRALSKHLDALPGIFEETMDKIAKAPYVEQEKQLNALKKLLQEEIYVIKPTQSLSRSLARVEHSVSGNAEEEIYYLVVIDNLNKDGNNNDNKINTEKPNYLVI